MRSVWIGWLLIGLLTCWTAALAGPWVHDMRDSRLAEITVTSPLDIKAVQEVGGIFENYNGRMHRAYLLPEHFTELQVRGVGVRWMSDDEIDPYGDRFRPGILDEYHMNEDIEADFAAYASAYPTLFSYESIGHSIMGRNLWMAKLSDNVTVDEAEIEVKYISTMHGNEPVGTENCMRFIDTLLTGYGIDPEITELMEDFEIFIMPLMNPDGRATGSLGQRTNANGVDLNRNFPDRIDDSTNTTAGREPETAAVMDWSATRNCILSANFHTGALVANYPWDNNPTHTNGLFSPTPEQDLFYHVSLMYAQENEPMYSGGEFENGVTNGTEWYTASGTMQDWNYIWMGCKETTIELSDVFSGPESALEQLWWDNERSMRVYLLEAREGVRGFVTDAVTGDPLRAEIQLSTISYLTYSSSLHGEYYRVLRPGTYELTFSAPGYDPVTFSDVTVTDGEPTILDVQLNSGAEPEITVQPDNLSTGVEVCGEADVPLTILNSGAGALAWSAGIAGNQIGGWHWIDSDDPAGPTYDWVDISSIGTEVDFDSDDENLGPFAIGFDFPYYGSSFSTFRLSANGWLSFTSSAIGNQSYVNEWLPDASAPENLIAPWWDDLSPWRTGATVWSYTNNTDSLVITFDEVESYSGGGLYTFQMILLSSGKMVYQYQDMGSARLESATIGLQDDTRSEGFSVICNDAYVHDALAIELCPNVPVLVEPSAGMLGPTSQTITTVRVNSCCLVGGLNYLSLDVVSNDSDEPTINVPLTVNVGQVEPNPVTDLTAVVEGTGIRLRWSSTSGAASYEVWKGSTSDFTISTGSLLDTVSGTTYLDNSLPLEGVEFYFVIALP